MDTVILQREQDTDRPDEGVYGLMTTPDGLKVITLELPDRDNDADYSRILAGIYDCELRKSIHFQMMLYHVLDVPGRVDVEMHYGNWAGDVKKGYKSDVEGCVLQGISKCEMLPPGKSNTQKAVCGTLTMVKKFISEMGGLPFKLDVRD